MKKIVVYTAIFGDYDKLVEPDINSGLRHQADFVVFTDEKRLKSDFFNVRVVDRPHKDPVRSNRYYKLLSHQVLPEYKISLYFDGNVKLKDCNYQDLVARYLSDNNFTAFKHPSRQCLYEEAAWVKSQHIDPVELVNKQINGYEASGFPRYFGLTAGTFLLRKHTPDVIKFNELWWEEYMKGSRRDQLSLDFARWKSGITISYMSGSWDVNEIGVRMAHAKPLYKNESKLSLKALVPIGIKKWLKYRIDKSYQQKVVKANELKRVNELNPRQSFTTTLLGPKLKAPDKNSFVYMYKEIFIDKIYEFKTNSDRPYIIDGGANIGLASIFFANTYPNAEVVAFEADPNIANICQENMTSFGLTNVKLIRKALWSERTILSFQSEGSDAGRIDEFEDGTLNVQTDILSEYISKKVDLLKLDIEGAEVKVLEEVEDKLHLVNNLFVEYHSFVSQDQQLEKILLIIKRAGFRYILNTPSIKNRTPLKTKLEFMGMDFYINIFATRN